MAKAKSNSNTIFVQIASYRDPQLVPTLTNMLATCSNPKNLHVSICWQHGPDETLDMFTAAGFKVGKVVTDERVANPVIKLTKDGAKFSVMDVYFHNTKGACWARNQVQQLYNNEKYTLQLDSHHRFIKNWDGVLVDMIESVRTEKTPKPLLTSYVSSFDPENDPGIDYDPETNRGARVTEPWRMDFDRFIPEGAVFFLPATIDNWQQLDKPVLGRFYSAHFAFADGTFAVEVSHDPEYFFHGEEISIAVRAFTHGYDIFHPHRVVVWHEYTRKGRVKVWDDHTTGQKNKGRVELDWVERNNICHRRNRILFGMDGEDPTQIEFGKYGFGNVRTVRQYEEWAGISFQFRGVQQGTLDRSPNYKYPPSKFYGASYTEEEWKSSFVRSSDLRIMVHRGELMDAAGKQITDYDYDFFCVAAHDDQGEIHRKDLQENEIKNHLQHEWIDYRFIFFADRIPTVYHVLPHSKSRGWDKLIIKQATG